MVPTSCSPKVLSDNEFEDMLENLVLAVEADEMEIVDRYFDWLIRSYKLCTKPNSKPQIQQ